MQQVMDWALKAGVRGAVPSEKAPAQMGPGPSQGVDTASYPQGDSSVCHQTVVCEMNFCHHAACLQYTLESVFKGSV